MSARHSETIACPICGKPFKPEGWNNRRTCSTLCTKIKNRKRFGFRRHWKHVLEILDAEFIVDKDGLEWVYFWSGAIMSIILEDDSVYPGMMRFSINVLDKEPRSYEHALIIDILNATEYALGHIENSNVFEHVARLLCDYDHDFMSRHAFVDWVHEPDCYKHPIPF